ncbi:phage tail protein [Massilia consociata]|uniref:Phage tail protein n=1 Tax=Massilia consociata TaxID=760117 RepID=A0ABV6FFB1_9BURK
MSDHYVGEIRMFAGNYAPEGWAMCNGQVLPISGNEALFSLIGPIYGGDGQATFALPDMRGRVPISAGTAARTGTSYILGQSAGTETVTLSSVELAPHTHPVNAQSVPGTVSTPTNGYWATVAVTAYERPGAPPLSGMSARAISIEGGGQAHDNMMPYMTLTFIIALSGIYPST